MPCRSHMAWETAGGQASRRSHLEKLKWPLVASHSMAVTGKFTQSLGHKSQEQLGLQSSGEQDHPISNKKPSYSGVEGHHRDHEGGGPGPPPVWRGPITPTPQEPLLITQAPHHSHVLSGAGTNLTRSVWLCWFLGRLSPLCCWRHLAMWVWVKRTRLCH